MAEINDPKFDAIRKLPTTELVGIRMGWEGDAALASLVEEYDAAINAANSAELMAYFKSIQNSPASAFDPNNKNFVL